MASVSSLRTATSLSAADSTELRQKWFGFGGNSTPQQIEAILRRNAVLIVELIQNPDLHYLEII
jgi:hypothetical protein